jgi:aquaporin Z
MTQSERHQIDGFQAQSDPVQAMVHAQHGPATDHLLAGEPGWARDSIDPSFQWRRRFSELLGTFQLVLVAAAAAVIQDRSSGHIGRIAEVAAPVLTVLTVMSFVGAMSGAHTNSIVIAAFSLCHDFHPRRMPGNILAQLLGALLAALLLRAVFGDVAHLGSTLPGTGLSTTQAFRRVHPARTMRQPAWHPAAQAKLPDTPTPAFNAIPASRTPAD